MKLSEVKAGTKVTIRCVECGHCLKQRLCDLGLYDGTTIIMDKNDNKGPIIVKAKETKLVLGRGQAERITVKG